MEFAKHTFTLLDRFVKVYRALDETAQYRITSAAIKLADIGVGPKVRRYGKKGKRFWIEYDLITPLWGWITQDPTRAIARMPKLIMAINESVVKMHAGGWAHGDLCLSNLGFKPTQSSNFVFNIVILDPDTMYKIDDGQTPQMTKLGWTGTFKEFVRHDYENWQIEFKQYIDDIIEESDESEISHE